MIELRNLTKAYPVKNGLRYVMRDVSLIIPSRTNLAILGPNGAGKSTLLRLIGGAEPADSGSIITDQEISWPLGLTSGFQGSLTGRENVQFVCRINGLNFDESRHVINQVVDFAEIGEYFDMPVSTYSSGMKGRLSFGLSMAFEFDVYLIDELTSVGDTIFREKAKAAFENIRKRASLIFVSHNLKTLKQSCQSALFMRDGMADFYQNIDDGIEAYAEYVKEHRNNDNPKDSSSSGKSKRRRKKSDAIFTAGDDGETSALTPAKKKARRRRARRVKKNLENPSQGASPDAIRDQPKEDSNSSMPARKKARKMARKAKKNLKGSPESVSQESGSGQPDKDSASRMSARKKARRKARRAKKNLENSPEGDSTTN